MNSTKKEVTYRVISEHQPSDNETKLNDVTEFEGTLKDMKRYYKDQRFPESPENWIIKFEMKKTNGTWASCSNPL